MTSLPTTFAPGTSVASTYSVRDAIASYRRAQYLVAGSVVTASSDADFYEDDEPMFHDIHDIEEGYRPIEVREVERSTRRPSATGHEFSHGLHWEDEDAQDAQDESVQVPSIRIGRTRKGTPVPLGRKLDLKPQETTPLIRKSVSTSSFPSRGRSSRAHRVYTPDHGRPLLSPVRPTEQLRRRPSTVSVKSVAPVNFGGKSTFGQTLFNSIAILLGIGMLSEPLAFAYSGWLAGTILIVFYGFISCYTAKILARIIFADPRIRSYADIGRKAFGPTSMTFISILFCLELFSVSVVLVTLYADSLHTLIPTYSTTTYKLWGLLLLIPTIFLPLSVLSYTSILGILSSILIIVVVLVDGLSKTEAPGSLWSPAATSFQVEDYSRLGLAFGLFMAGFSGHAVIPSLARDMADPSQFDRMINWAFVIATFLYGLIGYAGYLMFGSNVSDEISIDLLSTVGYNPALNRLALWMLVICPLTKFALTTQPLNATIEILFGIDGRPTSSEALDAKTEEFTTIQPECNPKKWIGITQRVAVAVLSVFVSISIPEFSSMMAFLGSFSAFLLCIIGPVMAKVMLEHRCSWFDGILLLIAIAMASWGTFVAFVYA